jgi:hypothetical protein
MVVVTILALGGTAWMRFRRDAGPPPPAVGTKLPPLELLDTDTSESMILLGLRGKVIWLSFWSAANPSSAAQLVDLGKATRRLREYQHFVLIAPAIEAEHPEVVQAAIQQAESDVPVYLAGRATRLRFGVDVGPGGGSETRRGEADLPLHLLVDVDGRILAMARGSSPATLSRIARQAQERLDEVDPGGAVRFAAAARAGGHRLD